MEEASRINWMWMKIGTKQDAIKKRRRRKKSVERWSWMIWWRRTNIHKKKWNERGEEIDLWWLILIRQKHKRSFYAAAFIFSSSIPWDWRNFFFSAASSFSFSSLHLLFLFCVSSFFWGWQKRCWWWCDLYCGSN